MYNDDEEYKQVNDMTKAIEFKERHPEHFQSYKEKENEYIFNRVDNWFYSWWCAWTYSCYNAICNRDKEI